MRVLFPVFPNPAHLHPIVSCAWALQSAGHEVCVATPPGIPNEVSVAEFHRSVNATGLTAVSCGEPQAPAMMESGPDVFVPTLAESERYLDALAVAPADQSLWDCFYHFMLTTIRGYIPPKPRQDADAVVEFARAWRPDLVVWDPWFPVGAVAAKACGAAHARLPTAPDYTGWATRQFARAGAAGRALPENPLAETMGILADRHGVDNDEELLLGQWTIDPFPEAMRLTFDTPRVQVRNTPYTGASVKPEWLYGRAERPRVALTLGVTTREARKADWGRTAKILDAVADLDIEVIATLNAEQLLDVPGGVPKNVRTFDYVPLGQLLPTCTAVIHHGAPATTAAATSMNLPQLMCDTDERPRFVGERTDEGIAWTLMCEKQITASHTAAYVTGRGAGIRVDHQKQSAEEIRAELVRLLEDPAFRAGAESIHREWLATPSPTEIVPVLERLTEQHRRR